MFQIICCLRFWFSYLITFIFLNPLHLNLLLQIPCYFLLHFQSLLWYCFQHSMQVICSYLQILLFFWPTFFLHLSVFLNDLQFFLKTFLTFYSIWLFIQYYRRFCRQFKIKLVYEFKLTSPFSYYRKRLLDLILLKPAEKVQRNTFKIEV